jgi:predicted transcriptional regulator
MSSTAVSVKLSDEQRDRLGRVAKATKRSAHFHMKEAVDKYLDDLEWRLDLQKEANAALEDYRETGLHYSAEAIEEWSKSGCVDLPPPEKA